MPRRPLARCRVRGGCRALPPPSRPHDAQRLLNAVVLDQLWGPGGAGSGARRWQLCSPPPFWLRGGGAAAVPHRQTGAGRSSLAAGAAPAPLPHTGPGRRRPGSGEGGTGGEGFDQPAWGTRGAAPGSGGRPAQEVAWLALMPASRLRRAPVPVITGQPRVRSKQNSPGNCTPVRCSLTDGRAAGGMPPSDRLANGIFNEIWRAAPLLVLALASEASQGALASELAFPLAVKVTIAPAVALRQLITM